MGAFTQLEPRTDTALSVNHQGQFPSVTLSFNLAPGVALSDAAREITELQQKLGMPSSVQGMFSGALEAFQSSLATEPLLILTAIAAVYIVLGILYESYIHPITILSTLPSAGVGAVLALMVFHTELTVIALIGIVLLIGIVKKNAILMIDFAITAERNEGRRPEEAIFQACLLRFRPILMTTMAALFGAMPLAFRHRRRIGIKEAAGNHDCWRPDFQPGADALHHSRGVPLHGPAEPLVATGTSQEAPQHISPGSGLNSERGCGV